jgi:lipopolysaccharide transport system permease protein
MKAGIRIWAEMFRELVDFRGLIWRLVVRDITARYKQSVFGILWAFLAPLVMMFVFVWVKNKSILPIGETIMPYAAFVFLGQIVWLLFSHGVTTCANCLVAAGSMLTKINFPKEVLVLSAVGQTIFEFLIRIPLLLIVFVCVGFTPKLTILLVPFALLPLLLLVVGLGFFVSLFNAIIRDVSSVLGIFMNLGMFVTPVIYPPPATWPISFWINYANPVSGFVTAARDLVLVGSLTDPASYVSSVIVSILLFFVGWRLFHLVEPKIAERV